MSTKVRIKMNPGYATILTRDRRVANVVHDAAEQAAEIARADAPVASGHYRDSIEVDDQDRLVATEWYAHFVEFGTIHNRAFRTLTNAADEVASRLVVD